MGDRRERRHDGGVATECRAGAHLGKAETPGRSRHDANRRSGSGRVREGRSARTGTGMNSALASRLSHGRPPDLALFLPSYDRGGVERMMAQLARGLAGLGLSVDMVIHRRSSHYLDDLPASVRVVELAALGGGLLDAAVVYCRCARPALLLSSKDENNQLALKTREVAGTHAKVWLRAASTLSSRVLPVRFARRQRHRRNNGAVPGWRLAGWPDAGQSVHRVGGRTADL
jgi:hypothetical protein